MSEEGRDGVSFKLYHSILTSVFFLSSGRATGHPHGYVLAVLSVVGLSRDMGLGAQQEGCDLDCHILRHPFGRLKTGNPKNTVGTLWS